MKLDGAACLYTHVDVLKLRKGMDIVRPQVPYFLFTVPVLFANFFGNVLMRV
jgi:hypothetical protein